MAKHLSLLGVIVLVGFAYCYFGPVTEMELDLVEVQLEIAGLSAKADNRIVAQYLGGDLNDGLRYHRVDFSGHDR